MDVCPTFFWSVVLKNEHPTSNTERPTSNKKINTQYWTFLTWKYRKKCLTQRRWGRREIFCCFAFCWPRRNRLRIPWGGGCQKAKSIHLRWVGFIKALSCSMFACYGLFNPQLQLPSVFSSPPSQRRWKKISISAFSASRAKRAVKSYSRAHASSKAETTI